MESSIRAILDMDKEARRLEEQAQEKRRTAPQTVEQHRRDLDAAYESGVAEATEYVKGEQTRRVRQEKTRIDARQTELLAQMAAQVEQQHDAWVAQLVQAVTEQE